MRYRLDDLGAYQFEMLSQSILKSRIGLSVESWGRRADFGRDAYTPNPLRFPNEKIEAPGPFLFQVKFVEGANAAGAKPKTTIIDSASKEIARIEDRKTSRRWVQPTHFTFLTNSPVDSISRDEIRRRFQSSLPNSAIIIFGGDDICDLLDESPNVCRSFPQLLSIRDLDVLIRSALTHDSAERSAAAIDLAREIVPVFAPTSTYDKAWQVLRAHHFAVLEGPPEVGKSAIAWMIGLSQIGLGWEAVYCRRPNDFFEMYDSYKKQIFIADDAFGRTEYDPARASYWEAELDLVLHRLDQRHWLIWTSRKHILERAVARMDVVGKGRSFPDPGAVLVDVKSLSFEERALVLFRHARASNLEESAKKLVRGNARDIIDNPDFTPERMRRFIRESLPLLVTRIRAGTLSQQEVKAEIAEAIRNPTKQMRLTFRGLPIALKWYLIAMLELPPEPWRSTEPSGLSIKYESYCPDNQRIPFEEATQQLNEAFIRVRREREYGRYADWIHPSYRDLVIDELISDSDLRTQFLARATLEGVKLAVSDTGGDQGARHLPFMLSGESWDVLQERALAIVRDSGQDRDLLEVLSSAAISSSRELAHRWEGLVTKVCGAVKQKWDAAKKFLEAEDVAAFRKARSSISSTIQLPDFSYTWLAREEEFHEGLASEPTFDEFDFQAFNDLTSFAEEVEACTPGFLSERGFPDHFEAEMESVFELAKGEYGSLEDSDDGDKLKERASDLTGFAESLGRISNMSDILGSAAYECSEALSKRVEQLEEKAAALDPPEPDYDRDEGRGSPADGFDLGALFAEL